MSIAASYISAVKKAKDIKVPMAEIGQVLKDAGLASYEEQLGYSIVHITEAGNLAKSLNSAKFMFMPHVIARGDLTDDMAKQMRQHGFTATGLCKGRKEVDERQKEAARLLELYNANFTAPTAKAKKAPKPKVAKAVEEPTEERAQEPAEATV